MIATKPTYPEGAGTVDLGVPWQALVARCAGEARLLEAHARALTGAAVQTDAAIGAHGPVDNRALCAEATAGVASGTGKGTAGQRKFLGTPRSDDMSAVLHKNTQRSCTGVCCEAVQTL